MDDQKLRHELKHYINQADYFSLKQRLKTVTQSDPYAVDNGKYHIRSLYFDNIDDKVLREKLDSNNNREKFRIRYYNDDTSLIRIEKKRKINNLCAKQSAPVSLEQCERLICGDIEWMKQSQAPLLAELYAKMRFQQLKPKTVVDYIREPFIYEPGNIRITIDTEIRTGMGSMDLFNKELPTIGIGTNRTMILEVKYDRFLPEIISDIIQTRNRQSTAFSKYAFCRMIG